MTIDETPLPQRVASCYSALSAAAKELNSISDELGKSIAEIDVALKKLNLGVAVWIPIRGDDGGPNESSFWSEDLGYAKIGSTWGICLRRVTGDHMADRETVEPWLFNDAPRTLRISAIEKIPDLLERLSTEATKTTKRIRAKLSDAQVVAQAVKDAATTPRTPLRIPGTDAAAASSPTDPSMDSVREAVTAALEADGHNSASELLRVSIFTLEDATLRIEVPGIGKKMLSLTVNAAAEKVIRQELQKMGMPSRFLVVPSAKTEKSPASAIDWGANSDALEGVKK